VCSACHVFKGRVSQRMCLKTKIPAQQGWTGIEMILVSAPAPSDYLASFASPEPGSPRIPSSSRRSRNLPEAKVEFKPASTATASREELLGTVATSSSVQPSGQHLSRPMLMREISKPVGVILIDCLQLVVVTAIAAENVGPLIETLKPLPVKRPATDPIAA
jgi:hypothetical protein